MRASLRERLLAGGADDVRVVVESLAEEFDVLQIASMAVKMALECGIGGADDEKEIPPAEVKAPKRAVDARKPAREERGDREWKEKPRPSGPPREKGAAGGFARVFIGAGRIAGVRPGDLVGAITGEAGVESRVIGSIEIGDRFAIVEVPKNLADDIITALRATKIRGRKVTVNRDRGQKS
jgi:ATP-dependent RNA helicase DeaD